MRFTVGADCQREVPLVSTTHYGGSLGDGIYSPASFNGGPSITVQKDATSVDVAAAPDSAVVGQDVSFTVTTTGIGDGETVTISGDGVGVATAAVNRNSATFTRSFSSIGTKDVEVSYAGSSIAHAAGPATASVEVGRIPSQIELSVGSPTHLGAPVPLIAATTGIPDGHDVEFYVGTTRLGSANVSAGKATYMEWVPEFAGPYSVRASYPESATVAASSSGNVGVTVTDPTQVTSTKLDVSPDPVPGVASTLTATVTDGKDGDTVEFSLNGQSLVPAATLANGVASIQWTPNAGQANTPYSITATYVGSAGFADSTSDPISGTIGLVQTEVSVVTAPNTAIVGDALNLTATVTGGIRGESISFKNGETELCSISLSAGGTVSCPWLATEAGTYEVTAHYGGTDTTRPASSPSATTITVGAKQSGIELTGPTSANVGLAETFTASVTGIADGETITFEIEGEQDRPVQVNNGQAILEWTPSATGTREIRAVYAGTENVKGSESEILTVVVDAVQTTTSAVTASADPVTGAPVTLSATVTGGTEGADVEFRNGETLLCKGEVDADGTATCSWSPNEVGVVAVTAHYLGDDTTGTSQSQDATTVQVGQGTVAAPTELTVTPAAPTTADTVTVTGQAPAGSKVSVTAGGQECVATAAADGSFTCDLGTLPVGQNQIQVVAELNETNSEITSTSVEVGQASSSVDLTGPASVQPNQPAQLEIDTTGIADGQTVNIVVNDEVHGPATVTGGAATYSWTPTEAGTYTIRADYEGTDAVKGTQSNDLTITVDALSSSTSRVTASPSAVPVGDTVTLSATVNGGTEGIAVEFRNGDDVLCSDTLGSDGTVSCDWQADAVGAVNVVAHYLGEAGVNNPSHSAQATRIEVGKTASTVGLTATSPVEVGGGVQFTVTTTGIDDGQAVDIKVDDAVVASPTVSGGQATATWTAPGTTGTLSALAQYEGTDTVAGSESDPVSIEVGVAATSTSDVTASSGATAGEPVQLSATVTDGAEGVAVEFRDGTTVLCTDTLAADGTVECPWIPTDAGAVNVTAHYMGDDATGASQSANATTVTVAEAPDTEAPAAPTGVTVTPQPATVGETVTVTGSAEADSTVSVKVGGVEVCEVTAADGTFTCTFPATEEMDGQQVTVTATDEAGNTSTAADGGALEVQPEAVDPTEPTITLTPAQPVAGEKVEIEITGDAGEEVVIVSGDSELCRVTLDEDGTATCEWTPDEDGQTVLVVTVGDQTVEKTVTVRPADDDGDDGDDNDDGAGSGSLDMGSLGSLTGGAGGASGSSGSLASLGS